MTATGVGVRPRPRAPRPALLVALGGTGSVVWNGFRVFGRHWPVLFALILGGLAGRDLLLLGAIRASKVNGVLGLLVMVLAPIALLASLILMLRAVRSSLPRLAATTAPAPVADPAPSDPTAAAAAARPRTLLDFLGSALVPFLAVYASMHYLANDVVEYRYGVWFDDSFNRADVFDGGPSQLGQRLPDKFGAGLVAVIVVAIVLRWLLARWQGRAGWLWLGIVGAYVEVIWLVVIAGAVTTAQEPVVDWVRDRRVTGWLIGSWEHLLSQLGPVTDPARTASTWLFGLLTSADAVIVVPIAWLTVGAVVYGQQVAASDAPELYRRAAARWSAVPGPIRFVGTGIGRDLRERFGPLVGGWRLLARAGLAPMLFFCVAFLIAQGARDWLWELERLAVGPRDLNTRWLPLSGPLAVLNEAVGMVLLVCLLAAAVDRVLRTQPGGTRQAGTRRR